MRDLRIAVVGAGIGALTLALALREKGLSCTLYEAASELREVGAAVGLSAASTRYYIEHAGLEAELAEHWFEVQGLLFRDGRDGRTVGEHRFDYRARYGAPWVGIHRADFQHVLSGAVGADTIRLGKRVVDIDDSGTEAVLHFADGSTAADLVIGADGARSTVRRVVLGYDDALYSGASAFRGIVPVAQMPSMPDPEAIQFWMGPGQHCLHYPMNAAGDHNFFLVERNPSPWPHKGWIAPTDDEEKLARFGDWHPAVVEMVSAASCTQRWALFHRPPLSRWSKGRITLLGDAAHAMVPHHGQGANTSIEDAIVLADQLAAGLAQGDLDGARTEYERLRRGRTRKIQYASITTADVLHLPDGHRADERNARLADPKVWDQHLDWVHGFRPGQEEPSEVQGGTWL